jgi:8-oxo-dGTP pyrophosphatase MutT (NUDIX family)
VLDAAGRVLLFEVEDHDVFDPNDPRGHDRPAIVWCTPGGGVEPGETYDEAARRELREETGLTVDRLGPCVHEDEWVLHFHDVPVLLRQRYFLVQATGGDINLDGLAASERSAILAHRWWTLGELRETAEEIFPPALHEIVSRALRLR